MSCSSNINIDNYSFEETPTECLAGSMYQRVWYSNLGLILNYIRKINLNPLLLKLFATGPPTLLYHVYIGTLVCL